MVPSSALESAVVILVDSPALEAIYRDTYPVMAEQGVPLHVTLVYPFVPPDDLPAALGAVVAGHESFAFELTELRTFPEHVWIAPEPAAPFRALTASIEAAFPDHLHWKGEFPEVIPHATLAHVEPGALDASLARLRARVDPLLPFRQVVGDVAVLAGDGQWSLIAQLPLRG